tara:strand:+ start:360 stop:722 length:363 start_codon:yes stop_codon:yes gene_type:complete
MKATIEKSFCLDAEALETIEDNCCSWCDWASEIWFQINPEAPESSTIKVVEEHDEMEGSNTYYLSVKQLEEAFDPCIKSVNSDIASYLVDFIDTNDAGHLDAEASDCLLQFACFGELVYG